MQNAASSLILSAMAFLSAPAAAESKGAGYVFRDIWNDAGSQNTQSPARSSEALPSIGQLHHRVQQGRTSANDQKRKGILSAVFARQTLTRSQANHLRMICAADICEVLLLFRNRADRRREQTISTQFGNALYDACRKPECRPVVLVSGGRGDWQGLSLLGYAVWR